MTLPIQQQRILWLPLYKIDKKGSMRSSTGKSTGQESAKIKNYDGCTLLRPALTGFWISTLILVFDALEDDVAEKVDDDCSFLLVLESEFVDFDIAGYRFEELLCKTRLLDDHDFTEFSFSSILF
jgi:hypothetical protein